MDRDRTVRPTAHAPVLVGLAALPLVLTTSAVGVTQSSAGYEPDEVPSGASASAFTAQPSSDTPATGSAHAEPASFETSGRPSLGNVRPGDIPWAALQAYQRAAEILREVEPGCGMSWQLLAAVGQVESAHGLALGGKLGDDGVVRPAVVGGPLNGEGSRPAVADTDGGELDRDARWDRAVGPMQLLPGVWAVAGVDGDGDGNRSEQDIDDAALATGVYLCASGADVGTDEGAAEALRSYNASDGYVDRVRAVEAKYRKGDFEVAERPEPQTIGRMLDYGSGTAAERDSERALREAKDEPGATLAARRGETSDHAAPEAEVVAAGPAESDVRDGSRTESEETPQPSAEETPTPTEAAGAAQDDEATDEADAAPGEAGVTEEAEPAQGQAEPANEPGEGEASREPADEEQTVTAGPTAGVTEGPTQEPAEPTEEPAAEPTEAEPTEEPAEDGQAADPSEEPTETEPETTEVTGVLTPCGENGESYCVDEALLDLSSVEDVSSEAAGDFDGDGDITTVAEELAGLEGETVELVVVEDSESLFVVTVNGIAIQPA